MANEQKVIWKHQLPVNGYVELLLPKNADLLTIGNQDGFPVLWECHWVQFNKDLKKVLLACVFTGEEIEARVKEYIGTTTNYRGLVTHVFLIAREA